MQPGEWSFRRVEAGLVSLRRLESGMTDIEKEDWRGLAVHGGDGTWIGQVAEVYDVDEYATGMPALVAVRTGLLGLRVSFVPLRGVAERDGDTIRVPYTKDQVVSAPGSDQVREIDPDDVQQIHRHYGIEAPEV
jgi:hypothetical protein